MRIVPIKKVRVGGDEAVGLEAKKQNKLKPSFDVLALFLLQSYDGFSTICSDNSFSRKYRGPNNKTWISANSRKKN